MGLISGPITLQRFLVSGPFPEDIDDAFVEQLQKRAFGHVPVQSDDTQAGWIGSGHLFDTQLDAARLACGRFAHLALRVDRLKIPTNVFRGYVRMAEEAAKEASGRDFLSKTERRHARELALTRAAEETRSGAFRRSNAYPVLIDLEGRTVYLGTTSSAVADKLMPLFADTFGASLEPINVERLADRFTPASRSRAYEQLAPYVLAKGPSGEASPEPMVGDLTFLGKEFLTWLWFQAERDAGPLRVSSGDELSVAIERVVKLKCDFGVSGTATLAAESPTGLPEARAALRSGKQAVRMGLLVGGPAGEYRLALDGPSFAVSGLVVPEEASENDAEARLEQRFEALTEALELLDGLFEAFLQERLATKWDESLQALTAWAAGGGRELRLAARGA